jgi:hypothetical protein
MDVDEFIKRVRPASRKSKLRPFIDSIQQLIGMDYTHEQVRNFLKENGVEISRAGLSAFLIRQERNKAKTPDERSHSPPRQAKPERTQSHHPEPDDDETTAAGSGSHNPAALDEIINQKPDLTALAKLARKRKTL